MKQFVYILLCLLFFSVNGYSQKEPVDFAMAKSVCEQMPKFMGDTNINRFTKWVMEHISYPAELYKEDIQGRVTAEFIVETDGTIANVNILKSAHPLLSNEVVRILKLSPKWTPAVAKGENVRVKFTFPIVFAIRKNRTEGEQIKHATFEGSSSNEFANWIIQNLNIPDNLKNIEGKITVGFAVTEDGSVKNVRILKGLNSQIDELVVKTVNNSPKWEPAIKDNKPVTITYAITIVLVKS